MKLLARSLSIRTALYKDWYKKKQLLLEGKNFSLSFCSPVSTWQRLSVVRTVKETVWYSCKIGRLFDFGTEAEHKGIHMPQTEGCREQQEKILVKMWTISSKYIRVAKKNMAQLKAVKGSGFHDTAAGTVRQEREPGDSGSWMSGSGGPLLNALFRMPRQTALEDRWSSLKYSLSPNEESPWETSFVFWEHFSSLAEAFNIDQQSSAERNGCWGGIWLGKLHRAWLRGFLRLQGREGAGKGQQGREEKQRKEEGLKNYEEARSSFDNPWL